MLADPLVTLVVASPQGALHKLTVLGVMSKDEVTRFPDKLFPDRLVVVLVKGVRVLFFILNFSLVNRFVNPLGKAMVCV